MKMPYTVHSCVEEPVAVKAMVGDREVEAMMPGLVVEMVSGTHGHTFRLAPTDDKEMAAFKNLFKTGQSVVATFSKGT